MNQTLTLITILSSHSHQADQHSINTSLQHGTFVRVGDSLANLGRVLLTEPSQAGDYNQQTTKLVILTHPNQPTQDDHHLDYVPDFLEKCALTQFGPNRITLNLTTRNQTTSTNQSDQFDPNGVISITHSSLAQLGLLSNDYVLVHQPSAPTKLRLGRVEAADSIPGDGNDQAIISTQLCINLNPNEPIILTSTQLSPADIPIARSVTLSLVGSDPAIKRATESQVFELLKEYLNQSTVQLKVGDLIQLDPTLDRSRFNQSDQVDLSFSNSRSILDSPVWFQVSQVDDATLSHTQTGFTVDPLQTRIIQSGISQHPPPPSPTRPNLSSFGPAGLGLWEYLSSVAGARARADSFRLQGSILLEGRSGVGKSTLARRVGKLVGLHPIEIDTFDLIGSSDVLTAARLSAILEQAKLCAPGLIILNHVNALSNRSSPTDSTQERRLVAILDDFITELSSSTAELPLILLGTSSDPDSLSSNVRALFDRSFTIHPPTQQSRLAILSELTAGLEIGLDVSLVDLAQRTAALVPRDLVNLVDRAIRASALRLTSNSDTGLDPDLGSTQARSGLNGDDVEEGLKGVRVSYSASIGAPKIPSVTWDQVGGLSSVKDQILETIQLPLSQPDLFGPGLKKRSGILLYGPPGTGKTLLAKAVATTCSLNFFSVKGPELLDMYIGESEANVRRVFERAREAKPCVIFFDELDSVAPKRGNQGDSGGVMDRIVSQLLAELDGMQDGDQTGDVFVIGATNRPDLLDPALLRPGRFDRMLYLGVSQTHNEQLNILHALTRQFKLEPTVTLAAIADHCPLNLTGADLYALCSDAMLKAMTAKASLIDSNLATINLTRSKPITAQYYLSELATSDEIQVVVGQAHFMEALAELVPSVSEAEMEHYKVVQRKFTQDGVVDGEVAAGEEAANRPDRKHKGKGREA